jgi:GMP synthase (glutamine-hydrolysing)
MNTKILIFDFGSQYTQLIARRIRELNIYCEIVPFNATNIDLSIVKGIILAGSPFSVRDENALQFPIQDYMNKFPILGICYGAQYIAQQLGGKVEKSNKREYGRANLDFIDSNNDLFKGLKAQSQVWMSHADSVVELPETC